MRYNYCKILYFGCLFFSILILGSCELKLNPPDTAIVKNNSADSTANNKELPEDFLQFYDRFHTDQIFQIDHIIWPLPGRVIENEVSGVQLTTSWAQEDWVVHKKLPADAEYDLIYTTPRADYVQEILMNRIVGHGLIRRWRKINGMWFLSYYSGMHPAEKLEQLL